VRQLVTEQPPQPRGALGIDHLTRQGATEGSDSTEQIGVLGTGIHRTVPAHGYAGDRTKLPVRLPDSQFAEPGEYKFPFNAQLLAATSGFS
jgi:hypothetical protein